MSEKCPVSLMDESSVNHTHTIDGKDTRDGSVVKRS
jgi:hypothetical protein